MARLKSLIIDGIFPTGSAKQDIFLTWRFKGSLPEHIRGIFSKDNPGKRFRDLDRALDLAEDGPLWLKQPQIADCIVEALRNIGNQRLVELHSYVVMSNHVHILMTIHEPLAHITRLVKGTTARRANLLLGLTGHSFWQDESFDHWVRNPVEWQKIRNYIEANPVKAGLIAAPADWPWSSASRPLK